ncbi:MAG: dihydroxyacetone kinase phosphoryl donor subunit DhaM [Chloroflexota bacterium]|nr:dihydroxyacetone kinase phosphoryl donor subunit DhaM [Chloroflexota bacterium]
MVGIVLVSHSEKLAEGLKEMVGQLSDGTVAVAAAGGGPEGELGTSAEKIRAAILSVAGPDGVLVLVDLGSATLSTETAIEMLDPLPCEVRISDAPLVEGAVVSVIHAGIGDSLDAIMAAAEGARNISKNLD